MWIAISHRDDDDPDVDVIGAFETREAASDAAAEIIHRAGNDDPGVELDLDRQGFYRDGTTVTRIFRVTPEGADEPLRRAPPANLLTWAR